MTSEAPDVGLQIRPYELELAEPFETAQGTMRTRRGFLVRVDAGDVIGIGEAAPLPGWTESYDDCREALENAIDVIDSGTAAALEAVEQTPAARHGLSLAIADRYATKAARPLYQYLGDGSRVARVPVNATVGARSLEEAVSAATTASDRGFGCLKLKVGSGPLEDDLERVRRVRAAVDENVELRVDANGGWTYDEAETALETLETVGVAILEQPLPAGALGGHTALRETGYDVDIALDEGLLEHGVDAICDAEAADVVVLKPMALGGIDVARELVTWLSELDIDPLVTTTIDGVVARTAAVHLAAAIPDVRACGLATGDLLANDLGRDPVVFEKGAAVVPQAKGLGIDDIWGEP
ncbi:mandelate racemase/muconate lactonizing enzyme family protein [Natrialbaceae archaeon A-chndr2]